ncbi:hypothetical protein [Streptomyces sp. NPDC029526]|uniref:hypothetical protein n=1 Tax=Streptomyces sp. NPDC029526 TaxID=3155728 RepID=UPI0034056C0C
MSERGAGQGVGLRSWWTDRRAGARIDRMAEAVHAGRVLVADATAYETWERRLARAGTTGVLEVHGDHIHFTANAELTEPGGGWQTSRTRIADVRDGDEPGELVVAFHTPAQFRAIVAAPFRHVDKWRALKAG